MAITNVPRINGPSFGGIIYGLSLQSSYTSSPSKLVLNIVSENGEYQIPEAREWAKLSQSKVSISLGDPNNPIFKFIGFPWSYSIKTNAGERILEVQLIDGSVALDRHYVLLWKPGIFTSGGAGRQVTKRFNFTDQQVLIPFLERGKVKYRIRNLGFNFATRNVRSANGRNGNIFYLGKENFPDSKCDISATYYTIQDLKTALGRIGGVSIGNFNAPVGFPSTHEGTAREVLNAWCADFGYEYFWDYSEDRIVLFEASKGVTQDKLPDIENQKEIIEKEVSETMEGTFRQFALSYAALPKTPIKTLPGFKIINFLTALNPIRLSYFLKRNKELNSIEGDVSNIGKWAGRDTENEFLEDAFLGYIDPQLRQINCFIKERFFALGHQVIGRILSAGRETVLEDLKTLFPNDYDTLKNLSDENLNDYEFYLVNHYEGLVDKLQAIESNMLNYLGSYYRHGATNSESFYCSNKSLMTINLTVDPEGGGNEDLNKEFNGTKVFNRQGAWNYSADSAKEELGLNDPKFLEGLSKCLPFHIDLIGAGLKNKYEKIAKQTIDGGDSINTLLIAPKKSLIDKHFPGFSISRISGINQYEVTAIDRKEAEENNNQAPKCQNFETALAQGQCIRAEDEAKKKALDVVYPQNPEQVYYSGLSSKFSSGLNIKTSRGNIRLLGPSTTPFYVVYKFDISVEAIDPQSNQPPVFCFNGSGGGANDVEQIDVVFENITDSEQDSFRQSCRDLPRGENIFNTLPSKSIKYVFAGEPKGLEGKLTPLAGLVNFDISYSSDGFKTTITYQTKPKKRTKLAYAKRLVQSQFNRNGFNGV